MMKGVSSNRNGSWNDENVALLKGTFETIDYKNGENHRHTFRQSAYGAAHDCVGRVSVIQSVNDIDKTSLRVPRAPSLSLLQHHLPG